MESCCFIGHRNTVETQELIDRVKATVIEAINNGVYVFYFGSRSKFNDICYSVVTELRQTLYPNLLRVWVRAEYNYNDPRYIQHILKYYEDTFFPSKIENAGRLSYVERNNMMIDASDVCIFYYDENYTPPKKRASRHSVVLHQPKSGTKMAFDYATKRKKNIINLYEKRD